MKKITAIILFFLVINLNSVNGCSCGDWTGGIVKNAQQNALTVYGKVNNLSSSTKIYKDSITTSIEVEILTKFKGKENREFITVWGDRGSDCRPYLAGIEIGSEWVFSLHKIKNEEYAISICGENIIPVAENKTWGYILYNDRCTIEKPFVLSIDSLQKAINNPSEFIHPTKSCDKGESKYFTEVNHPPRISENKSVSEFLKEKLNVRKDIRKEYEDYIIFEIFFDEIGNIERIKYRNKWSYSIKMKRRYGRKIIKILKKESPWIPAEHRGKKLPMKLRLEVKLEELIKK